MSSQLLAFTAVAAVLTVTPGADMAIVTRNALAGGLRAAFATALGIAAGCLCWAAAATLGVAALLSASSLAYNVLKIAGAVYLAYLGLRSLIGARRLLREPPDAVVDAPGGAIRPLAALRQGLTTNLLNPKIAVLYATLLPQFISPGDPVIAMSLAMALIHGVLGLAWLTLFARMLIAARATLERPRVRAALEALTGSVLVALGVRLALTRR